MEQTTLTPESIAKEILAEKFSMLPSCFLPGSLIRGEATRFSDWISS